MTAKDAAKSAGKWTALVGPAVVVTSILVTQGFCIPPWQQMSKAEARQEHDRLGSRIDRHEDKVTGKLDRLSADVHRIMGAVGAKRGHQ